MVSAVNTGQGQLENKQYRSPRAPELPIPAQQDKHLQLMDRMDIKKDKINMLIMVMYWKVHTEVGKISPLQSFIFFMLHL